MTAFVNSYFNPPFLPGANELQNPNVLHQYLRELHSSLQSNNFDIVGSIYGESSRFEPVAQGGTSAGTGTYDVQAGYYTRFGNLVWFSINLQWDNANHSGTGDLQITGLPVTSLNVTNLKSLVTVYNAQSGAEFVGVGFIDPNDKKISIIKNGGTTIQIDSADYDLQITGIYRSR